MPQSKAIRWCFTINNPNDDADQDLFDASPEENEDSCIKSLFYGREVGGNGTPYLQGFVVFLRRQRFHQVRRMKCFAAPHNAHLEVMKGTIVQNVDYCGKTNIDPMHLGAAFAECAQGRRTDLDAMVKWLDRFLSENSCPNTEKEVAIQDPKALTAILCMWQSSVLLPPYSAKTPNYRNGSSSWKRSSMNPVWTTTIFVTIFRES